jgi:hypothetical protein
MSNRDIDPADNPTTPHMHDMHGFDDESFPDERDLWIEAPEVMPPASTELPSGPVPASVKPPMSTHYGKRVRHEVAPTRVRGTSEPTAAPINLPTGEIFHFDPQEDASTRSSARERFSNVFQSARRMLRRGHFEAISTAAAAQGIDVRGNGLKHKNKIVGIALAAVIGGGALAILGLSGGNDQPEPFLMNITPDGGTGGDLTPVGFADGGAAPDGAPQSVTGDIPTQDAVVSNHPIVDESLIGNNDHVWGAFERMYGTGEATRTILDRVAMLEANGWHIEFHGDPTVDNIWGIESMKAPDGTTYDSPAQQVGALEYAKELDKTQGLHEAVSEGQVQGESQIPEEPGSRFSASQQDHNLAMEERLNHGEMAVEPNDRLNEAAVEKNSSDQVLGDSTLGQSNSDISVSAADRAHAVEERLNGAGNQADMLIDPSTGTVTGEAIATHASEQATNRAISDTVARMLLANAATAGVLGVVGLAWAANRSRKNKAVSRANEEDGSEDSTEEDDLGELTDRDILEGAFRHYDPNGEWMTFDELIARINEAVDTPLSDDEVAGIRRAIYSNVGTGADDLLESLSPGTGGPYRLRTPQAQPQV